MKKKHVFSGILLILLIMIGMLSVTVLADEAPSEALYVGGVQVTEDNQEDIFGDGTAEYDPETHTLTFDRLELDGEAASIEAEGMDLILEGAASFECTKEGTAAISVSDGNLTVNGEITALAKWDNAVEVIGGALEVNGELKAVSATDLSDASKALNGTAVLVSKDIVVSGKLTAEGTMCGVRTSDKGSISLKGGPVSVKGGESAVSSIGDVTIACDAVLDSGGNAVSAENVTIRGGQVNVTGAVKGILARGEVFIESGDVSVAAGRDGIEATGVISITGGTVAASGRNHGIRGDMIAVGEEITSVIASGDWAMSAAENIRLDDAVRVSDPEGGRLSDDGKSFVDAEGMNATRVELTVSDEVMPDESETEAPETEAPETETPETEAPETEAPETEAPETETPETEAPETEVPETEAPETEAPETEAPETEAPETEAPETKAPETEAPETKAPETEAPETKAPETEAPVTEAPETEAPETEAPPVPTYTVSVQNVYGDAVLTGGAFELRLDYKVVDTWTSDGRAHKIGDLKTGTYTLRQTKAPDGYYPVGDAIITIRDNGEISYNGKAEGGVFLVENEITRVSFLTLNADEKAAAGASLQILLGKDVIDEWTSNKGVKEIVGLKLDETYRLKEITAPQGCDPAEDQTFSIGRDKMITYSGAKDKDGNLLIAHKAKTASADVLIRIVDEKEAHLAGAKLELRNGSEVIDAWTSINDAHQVKGLKEGRYTLTEVTAPEGYDKAKDETITVAADAKITYSGKKDKSGNLLVSHKKTLIYYDVIFETGDGTKVAPLRVESGKTVGKPADPTRKGYRFDGWYSDPALKKLYDFKIPVKENLILYAKWASEKAGETEETYEKPVAEEVDYAVISGAGSTFRKGTAEDVTVTIKRGTGGDSWAEHLKSVQIDESLLTIEDEYTVQAAEGAITLKAAALDRFEVGTRALKVSFDDGEVVTALHIKTGMDNRTDPDGGNGGAGDLRPLLAGGVALVVIAVGVAGFLYFYKRKIR